MRVLRYTLSMYNIYSTFGVNFNKNGALKTSKVKLIKNEKMLDLVHFIQFSTIYVCLALLNNLYISSLIVTATILYKN